MSLLMIPGPEGALEASYHSVTRPRAPIVLIVPPHPEQDGNMDHPVVTMLFRTFASLGFNALRFNFRGCGKSKGTFTNSEQEVADAAACLDWLQNRNRSYSQCWVAGFSLGAYVALQLLMRRPECESFVALGVPANLYDFHFLAPCPSPGLIVHGEVDAITPKDFAIRLAHHLSLQRKGHKIEFQIISKANHVFREHLPQVETLVRNYVQKILGEGTDAAVARVG